MASWYRGEISFLLILNSIPYCRPRPIGAVRRVMVRALERLRLASAWTPRLSSGFHMWRSSDAVRVHKLLSYYAIKVRSHERQRGLGRKSSGVHIWRSSDAFRVHELVIRLRNKEYLLMVPFMLDADTFLNNFADNFASDATPGDARCNGPC